MALMRRTFKSISEIINAYKSDDFLVSSLAFTDDTNSVHMVDTFKGIFEDCTIECRMSTDDTNKYKYRPQYLSYDLYGTTDLWFLILKLNDLNNPGDFTCEGTVKIFDPSRLNILNRLFEGMMDAKENPSMMEEVIV